MYTFQDCFLKICFVQLLIMKKVTAKYARQNFSEVLNEVHFGRKKLLITRSGKPLVILVSSRDYNPGKEPNNP